MAVVSTTLPGAHSNPPTSPPGPPFESQREPEPEPEQAVIVQQGEEASEAVEGMKLGGYQLIKRIGAGAMGSGIAQVAAVAGHRVIIADAGAEQNCLTSSSVYT